MIIFLRLKKIMKPIVSPLRGSGLFQDSLPRVPVALRYAQGQRPPWAIFSSRLRRLRPDGYYASPSGNWLGFGCLQECGLLRTENHNKCLMAK
jgi:hypothetical protein